MSQLRRLTELKRLTITLHMKDLVLNFFSADERHIFGSNVGNEFGVMLREKGPHKPKLVHDLVRIHSLMMYKDLKEYKIIDDTKSPIMRPFLFISKLQAGDKKLLVRV